MTGAVGLVVSVFGRGTSLYDAIGATKSDDQVKLKRAYRKAALKHHPDRVVHQNNDGGTLIQDATLKFQAVSAAYQVLMDTKRREVYDATGMDDNDDTTSSAPSGGDPNQQRWEEFFQSVFQEMITRPASNYGSASEYRGSAAEKQQVLEYWQTCKGNLGKMVQCIVHAKETDVDRWMKRIINPALRRGDVEDYRRGKAQDKKSASRHMGKKRKSPGGDASALLVDSDDDSNDSAPIRKSIHKTKGKRLKKKGSKIIKGEEVRRVNKKKSTSAVCLTDTDEDEDDSKHVSKTHAASAMSKRDMMEYRVAKKRKTQAQREMEVADIMQSKHWSGSSNAAASDHVRRKVNSSISRGAMARLERKYGR